MKIKVKLSGSFEKYRTESENEFVTLCFEKSVPVKNVLKKLVIPDNLPKLILMNGLVINERQMIEDGDTLSIFPTLSGG